MRPLPVLFKDHYRTVWNEYTHGIAPNHQLNAGGVFSQFACFAAPDGLEKETSVAIIISLFILVNPASTL